MLVAPRNVLQQLPDFSAVCDPRTARNLSQAVGCVLAGAPLQGTAIGRSSTPRGHAAKHSIKRMHRMLSSKTLHAAMPRITQTLAAALLPARPGRLVVLVDWVELRNGTSALVAGVPLGGRVVPISFSVHANAKRPSAAIHDRFLSSLSDVLPPSVRPIIVTDAGFQGTWLASVQRRGWDFVARLRHRTHVRLDGDQWRANKTLHGLATTTPKALGHALIGKESHACRVHAKLVIVRQRRRGRIAKGRNGRKLRGGKSIQLRAAAREPWLLATSLDVGAAPVVELYRQRMKIEQFFRDTKSHAFGRGLRQAFTSAPRPLAGLFLVAIIAHVITVLVGRAVVAAGRARQLQANTALQHLSEHRVGLLVLATCRDLMPSHRELRAALVNTRAALVGGA